MQIITAKDAASAKRLDHAIQRGNIIVLIYADWCPHCVEFKPEWERFKKSMRSQHPGMCHIGEVEQTYLDNVPSAQAQGFPTIKFYKAGTNNLSLQKQKPYLGRIPIENNPFAKPAAIERANASMGTHVAANNNEVLFEGQRSVSTLMEFANNNAVPDANTPSNGTISNSKKAGKSVKKARKSTKKAGKKVGAKKTRSKKTNKPMKKSSKRSLNKSVSQQYKEEKTKRDPVVMQELNSEFNNMASGK